MKYFRILFLAIISLNSFAQTEWFPLGAKWYYTHNMSDNYQTIEVVKDSLINGINAQKLNIIYP